MNTTIFPSSFPTPVPPAVKKKRVLLVDTSTAKRDMRSEAMRRLGMEVDCAADIAEARSWWKADLYDLVLIDLARGLDHSERFCDDIRGATPPQQLAFLVGAPEYVAPTPILDQELLIDNRNDEAFVGDVRAALSGDREDLPQRWGILEASRRISAVRSVSAARTRAMRDRPAPVRDSETRGSKRNVAAILDDLLTEEMQ